MAARRFEDLLRDPAPGLLFSTHKRAGLGPRVHSTPHIKATPTPAQQLEQLRELTRGRSAFDALEGFYQLHNGAGFCCLRDTLNRVEEPALTLLPVEEWAEATKPWLPGGDLASFVDGCESYRSGVWRVIGTFPSEEMSLVLFFDGSGPSGPLEGALFCIGLDGVLGYEEVLYRNFDQFSEGFARSPAAVFGRVGFSWYVSAGTSKYGDVIEEYLPNVRGHPSLVDWPDT